MANPFRRADRHGAPSIRPTSPESAETPMPDPAVTQDIPLEEDRAVNRPAAPPSVETPMEPPPAQPPTSAPTVLTTSNLRKHHQE
jgi:hypothetical protein